MGLDLETLLAPVSDDAPSGPDLAYDLARGEIDQAFDRPISVDATTGEAVSADVDWRAIVGQIETQSGKTKDLWLAAYLARAGAWLADLTVVVTGTEYLAGLCETYWDSVHPQLDEYGFQGRKGPCESLASVGGFLAPLRGVNIVEHPRLGRFTGLDFQRFHDGGSAQEGYDRFRAVLGELGEAPLQAAAAQIDAIGAALHRVDAVLVANSEPGGGANFRPAYEALAALRRAILAFSSAPVAREESRAMAEDDPTGPAAAPESGAASAPGRIETREDVLRALEAISDYYRRREPHSPVPLVLQRAREWISLDFLGVLADIAPNSLDEARRVLTYKKPDEY